LVDGSLESPCRLLINCNWTSFSVSYRWGATRQTCPNSLLFGGGVSVWAKISGRRGHPSGIFFGFYETRHILLFDSANCAVLRAVVLTQCRRVTDRRTNRQTDGIAIASTGLAVRASRRAVQNGGNRPKGSVPWCQNKTCFVFLLSRQRGLSATYPAPISIIFEITDVNRFPHAYTGEKNSNFRAGVFQVANSSKYRTLGWGLCDRAAAETAQSWAMGIISGASKHPKDVPLVREFWWRTYGLGAISPEKDQILATSLPQLT